MFLSPWWSTILRPIVEEKNGNLWEYFCLLPNKNGKVSEITFYVCDVTLAGSECQHFDNEDVTFLSSVNYPTTLLLFLRFKSDNSLQISIELGFPWGWWWRLRCGSPSHSSISSFSSFLLSPFSSSPTFPAPRRLSIMRLHPSTSVPALRSRDSSGVFSFSTLSLPVSNQIAVVESERRNFDFFLLFLGLFSYFFYFFYCSDHWAWIRVWGFWISALWGQQGAYRSVFGRWGFHFSIRRNIFRNDFWYNVSFVIITILFLFSLHLYYLP